MLPRGISTRLLRLVTVGRIAARRFAQFLCLAVGIAVAQRGGPVRTVSVEAGGLRKTRLNVVASSKMMGKVNYNDARAALKVWFDSVGRQRGFLLDSRIDILENVAEIRDRLQSRSVDVVIPSISEYLELESSRLIVPILAFALSSHGEALYSYVLLVNPSSTAKEIAGLRAKSILASSRGGSNTGIAWIDVLLGKEKLGRAESFFATIKVPEKAQACVLQVFFGTIDACVVDEVSLNLAKEMNPQLGRLKVLARSLPLIESLIATPVEPHPYQAELIDGILSLHEDPTRRQLLMVVKTDRIVRIQPGDLNSARELWRDYYRLPGSSPHRPPGSGLTAQVGKIDIGKERP